MVEKVEKDPGFPKYRWDPETGEKLIFWKAAEVPDGWISHPPSAGGEPVEEAEEAPKKKAPKGKGKAKGKGKFKKKDPAPYEWDLDISREEAIEILDEEGVKHAEDADDEAIAALMKELLENDNGK